jgi:E3 ubiquitin-protein ligase RNF139
MIAFTVTYVFEKAENNNSSSSPGDDAWWNVTYSDVEAYVQAVMAHGCDTIVGVLGMSSVVHSVCFAVGSWFHSFLQLDDDEQNSIGVVLSVLFFILAMQTGLTSLPVDKRVVRLCRNFCLVFTALLHFLHRMVNPILQSLSASR